MRWVAYWVVLVATALALGVAIALLASRTGSPQPSRGTDWDSVAACVWDRWDAGANMAPVMRFCVTWGPKLYGEVS